jgi:hypothetical protein
MLTASRSAAERLAPAPAGNYRNSKPALRWFFWSLTAITGLAQTWALHFSLALDGNNYLDLASAYLHRDFAQAINAYWSPMYCWMAAIPLSFLSSGYWESTMLHVLNFAGLLVALRCFEYFFIAFVELAARLRSSAEQPALDDDHWWLLGYGLFFSTMLGVLTMSPATPDIWVCVVTYLAMGTLLRIGIDPDKSRYYPVLGLLLGIGYLTKSFYFPLSFVYFLAAACLAGEWRRRLPRILFAVLIFSMIAGPCILLLSRTKHRLTFGDVGKIGYAESMNPIPQAFFWQGDERSGTPTHPPRRILTDPAIFEFGAPVGGSYPPSYDMSYWLEGVKIHFNVPGQLRILRQSAGTLFLIFLDQIEFAVAVAILFFVHQQRQQVFLCIVRFWPLWVVPASACVAYSLVLVENRYLAPFLVFLWLTLFVAVIPYFGGYSRRLAVAAIVGALLITGLKTSKHFVSDLAAMGHQENEFWQAAQGLHRLGVRPGEKVAIITGPANAHWARLAGVKIVAELPVGQEGIFWRGDESARTRVYGAFLATGSRAVIVKDPPVDAVRDSWTQLGNSSFYAHLLP